MIDLKAVKMCGDVECEPDDMGKKCPGWEGATEKEKGLVTLKAQKKGTGVPYCFHAIPDPWGDDFEDEEKSRNKWRDIAQRQEHYFNANEELPANDHPSQRRGCQITCATGVDGHYSHIEYDRDIPKDKAFVATIELHGDRVGQGGFGWEWNFGHRCGFKWYVTDGTKSLGLSWYQWRFNEGTSSIPVGNMAYLVDDVRNIVDPDFMMVYYFLPPIHIGQRFKIYRRADDVYFLYYWSNIYYFHDGSGEWVLAAEIPAGHFPETANLRLHADLNPVNGHVQSGWGYYNYVGYDNFTMEWPA